MTPRLLLPAFVIPVVLVLQALPAAAQDPGAGGVKSDSMRADTVHPVDPRPVDPRPADPRPVPGAGRIEVPRVTGLPVALAEARVRLAGLRSEVVEMASDRPAGTVARQSPQGGALARPGDTVTLFVAVPQNARVPNVIGSTRTRAAELLEQAGLALGGVASQASREPVGEVIAQRPEAGAAVPMGAAVAITVSDPQLVTVPAIVGRPRAQAESALRDAGLAAGAAREAPSSQPAGSVLAQDPAAGAVVERGTAVALTLAIAPPVVTAPSAGAATPVRPPVSTPAPATPAQPSEPATATASVPEAPSAGLETTAPQRGSRLPWFLGGAAVLLALAGIAMNSVRERRKQRHSTPQFEVRAKPGATMRAVLHASPPDQRDA